MVLRVDVTRNGLHSSQDIPTAVGVRETSLFWAICRPIPLILNIGIHLYQYNKHSYSLFTTPVTFILTQIFFNFFSKKIEENENEKKYLIQQLKARAQELDMLCKETFELGLKIEKNRRELENGLRRIQEQDREIQRLEELLRNNPRALNTEEKSALKNSIRRVLQKAREGNDPRITKDEFESRSEKFYLAAMSLTIYELLNCEDLALDLLHKIIPSYEGNLQVLQEQVRSFADKEQLQDIIIGKIGLDSAVDEVRLMGIEIVKLVYNFNAAFF